ncbi:MAG: pSer/pThr/pTyr-binding forkhead associated (FHA) protein [Planctomycetota bacterium]|jgi:pSer/pThr/pTyr-binding forkhead associated (FHA) protein
MLLCEPAPGRKFQDPMTTLWLYVLSGEELGRVETFQATELTIGRGEDVHLRLNSTTISRHHARLQVGTGGRVWIQDLESTSGTFVAGERIKRAELPAGAILRIADVELRVRVEYGEAAAEATEQEPALEMELEGEWEEGLAPRTAKPTPGAPAPPAAPTRKSAQPSAKDLRRAQEVGDLGTGPKTASTSGRKRILQYSQNQTSYGFGGGELGQRAPWQKALAIFAGLALLGGLAYGAFYLTQSARGTRAETVDAG